MFYALGTGFPFFYRFLYVLFFLMGIGASWSWLNLRGIEVKVAREADRGVVGSYLDGRVAITNRTVMPKSWLEVAESTGPSADGSGRGVSLVRNQTRSWKIETFLSKRGVYRSTFIQVLSQDPFGLFRFRRDFVDGQTYVVYPATEPLPNLDRRFAGLPSDSRVTRHWDQITTDVGSIRDYQPGDGFRRIHWPYTARMNSLMVKEFDIGTSAEAWVVLDMFAGDHFGIEADSVDNTEELVVSTAASITNRLVDLQVSVGLAANGERHYLSRPDSSPEHMGRLMDAFAEVRAFGETPLREYLYEVQSHVNQFNTVTVVTASTDSEWLVSLTEMRSRGVDVAAVIVDQSGFGKDSNINATLQAASASLIPIYVVPRGARMDAALSSPVNRDDVIGSPRYAMRIADRT